MLHKYYGEVLPYLEIQRNDVGENTSVRTVQMPNITGLTITEAKVILKDLGLEVEINGEAVEEAIVTDQLPKKGIQINSGTKVTIYTE